MNSISLQDYINQKISSGQFGSPEEFAAEAIRVYREIESEHEDLAQEVRDRIAQAESGDVMPLDMDCIKRQLEAELNADGTAK